MSGYHPKVPHPRTLLPAPPRLNEAVSRVASSALGSMGVFWTAFLVPLLTIPASDAVKLAVSIVFSSWFQAWALPVLQRAANDADQARQAKADADHLALSHLATQVDVLVRRLAPLPPAEKRTDV